MMQRPEADDWETYAAYNNAVAEVFFTSDAAGLPVYLDLDEDAVAAVGQRLGIAPHEVSAGLASAVTKVLDLRSQSDTFAVPLRQTWLWLRMWQQTRRDDRTNISAPPILALLAVFSMAAERMGSDSTMSPNNYFGRLSQLLRVEVTGQRDRLEKHYRGRVEFFWNVLGQWLVGLDGMRGLPSAVALSHRYVGLSISQALVRGYDRGKLPKFFSAYGLNAGQEIPPREIEPYLHDWLSHDPPPLSRGLANLWKRQPSARERISAVVALELQMWTGVDAEDSCRPQSANTRSGDVRLVALTRRTSLASRVELNIVARLPGLDGPCRMQVVSTVDDQKPILDFIPGTNGWHRLHRPVDLGSTSILDGILQLANAEGRVVERFPRPVVPMHKDEALGQFLEVERLHLAEDSIVFAVSRLADDVQETLTHVARPGFRRIDSGAEGVPEGWTLFVDVQVLGLLPAGVNDSINVLQPMVYSQLALADGLKLPGKLRKYAVQSPPELRAVAVAAEHLRLEVIRKDAASVDMHDGSTDFAQQGLAHVCESDSGALMLPMADIGLSEGDYEALLYVNREKNPLSRLAFFLRSSDSMDLAMWACRPRLAYQPARFGGRAILSADEDSPDSATSVGVVGCFGGKTHSVLPPAQVWWDEQAPPAGTAVSMANLTVPDPSSCLVNNAHYWELPYATTSAVKGTCRRCGMVKRFPNTYWAAKAQKDARQKVESQFRVDLLRIPPVKADALTWDIGLDALMHIGGGPYAALEGIALQIGGSSLFVDSFTRTLEVLGHIQIKRDRLSLQPVAWEVTPRTLAELADGSFLFVGCWPAAIVGKLEQAIAASPARLEVEPRKDAPSRRVVHNLTAEQMKQACKAIQTTVAVQASRSILAAVPNLSDVEESLERVGVPGARSVRQFHLQSASWVARKHADAPGAYCLESFGTTYVFRRAQDIVDGVARIGNAQIVKHLEALRAGRPLIVYGTEQRCLDVALGADLPGLYGRAAVLCAGREPEALPKKRLLRYHDVPADIAGMLTARLTS